MHTDDDTDGVMFSRTGMVSPMGTLTEVAKTYIDFETMAAFRVKANTAGMDVSSALRDFVYRTVHKKSFTDICVHAAKVKADELFGEGLNQDLIEAVK